MPSKDSPDQDFWDRADQHIALANSQAEEAEAHEVSASFMYACSRYCAFIASTQVESHHQLQADTQVAIDYYLEQFRMMLIDNFEDHVAKGAKAFEADA